MFKSLRLKSLIIVTIIFVLLLGVCLIATTPHRTTFEYAQSEGEGYYKTDNGETYDTNTVTPEGTKAKIAINNNGTFLTFDDEIKVIYIFDMHECV